MQKKKIGMQPLFVFCQSVKWYYRSNSTAGHQTFYGVTQIEAGSECYQSLPQFITNDNEQFRY